jgi:23S rRNA pseudouridine1911/1915/1917 synthase
MGTRLEVLHVDNHLLVVNKPAGLPTVPDDSGDESLLDLGKAWIKEESKKPGAVFLGVVHRLDRPVSGVVLFARTSKAAARMTAQFRDRETEKIYWGLVQAGPLEDKGTVDHWLRKDRERNRVHVAQADSEGAKAAYTEFQVRRRTDSTAWLVLHPRTGRSHQLRVACASLGCPLLGDLKYGAERPLSDRSIALHARSLSIIHPTLKQPLRFEAKVPKLPIWRSMV